jgi:hypothetical protein
MKILLVDWRNDRGEIITQAFDEPSINIKHSEHVNGVGGDIIGVWDANAKKSCTDHLHEQKPDMILLHVGDEQRRWKNCLTETYRDHVVLCFTGAPIPQEVANDCAINDGNPKHCYYPGTFETKYPTANAWRQSIEGSAVLKFIAGVEDYLKKAEDSSQETEEILQKAKETLQNFNPKLEGALDKLTDTLSILLQGGPPPNGLTLNSISKYRDDQLQNVYQ